MLEFETRVPEVGATPLNRRAVQIKAQKAVWHDFTLQEHLARNASTPAPEIQHASVVCRWDISAEGKHTVRILEMLGTL